MKGSFKEAVQLGCAQQITGLNQFLFQHQSTDA